MSGHTPGPWIGKFGIAGCGDRSIYGRAFDGSQKYIVDRVLGGNPKEAEANARLIAAAPDLLAVLIQLRDDWFEPHYGFNDCGLAALLRDNIRAAIAKAEGR